jgi:hypothetical protein
MDNEDEILIREVIECNKISTQNYVQYLYEKHNIIKNYKYLTLDNIDELAAGDRIIYFDKNGYPLIGGIFIKTINYYHEILNPLLKSLSEVPDNRENKIELLLLLNKIFYRINFSKHYIFFKKKLDKSDVLRNILLKKI